MLLSIKIRLVNLLLMALRKYLSILIALSLTFSMLSAAVPLHNILHQHYFVKADTCGNSCQKHLKNYSKPCCTTSDAVFLATLTKSFIDFKVYRHLQQILGIEKSQNYFQFFHFSKNKAPPILS